MKNFLKLGLVVTVLSSLWGCWQGASVVDADRVSIEPISKDLRVRYAHIESLLQANADSDIIAHELYWPEAMIAGEGSDVYRSREEFKPVLFEILKVLGNKCVFINEDPVVAKSDLAIAYTNLTCSHEGEPPLKFRVLYVWERRDNIWKVVRESYSLGEMN